MSGVLRPSEVLATLNGTGGRCGRGEAGATGQTEVKGHARFSSARRVGKIDISQFGRRMVCPVESRQISQNLHCADILKPQQNQPQIGNIDIEYQAASKNTSAASVTTTASVTCSIPTSKNTLP